MALEAARRSRPCGCPRHLTRAAGYSRARRVRRGPARRVAARVGGADAAGDEAQLLQAEQAQQAQRARAPGSSQEPSGGLRGENGAEEQLERASMAGEQPEDVRLDVLRKGQLAGPGEVREAVAPHASPNGAPARLLTLLPRLGVVQLRAELKRRGAATHGRKSALLSRLSKALAEEAMRPLGVRAPAELAELPEDAPLQQRLPRLRYAELRAELRALGLPQAGRKAELQQRLARHLTGDGGPLSSGAHAARGRPRLEPRRVGRGVAPERRGNRPPAKDGEAL